MSKLISSEEEREVRREQIVLLVRSYYEKLDFLHYEPLDLLIGKALDLFLDSDLTIDEINEKILEAVASRKKMLEERYDSENVKENHETIYGRLEQLARALNQAGIDYQLAGALCGYIKYDEESDRTHDDIDINLNEEDMDKFREICIHMGLHFEDNRLHSVRVLKNGIPSGEHEVIARDPNSDFHIGVFPFERKEDGTVISKGYYHDEDGSPCVREEIYSPELASEIFGSEEVDFRGTPLTITPPELIYTYKCYTKNEKDQHDILFLEGRIDQKKLMKIRMLSREGRVVQNVPVEDIPKGNTHNPFSKDDNELGLMLADDDGPKKSEDLDSSREKEGAKMLVKTNQEPQVEQQQDQSTSNEEGFISNAIITTLALITFVLCFIGIAVIYLIQMP